jgi:hypothetical protein
VWKGGLLLRDVFEQSRLEMQDAVKIARISSIEHRYILVSFAELRLVNNVRVVSEQNTAHHSFSTHPQIATLGKIACFNSVLQLPPPETNYEC